MISTDNQLATIKAENLTKRFGCYTAVDNISFNVYKGEIFGFLGANGAGKTTAIRMLCGLLHITSGSGHVAGFDIKTHTESIRTRIGYMSQKFSLYTDLTVMENLRLYGSIYGLRKKALTEKIQEMSSFLELTSILQRTTADLPWGWQQRLSLGCACLHEPSILFLDEPTGSVDPVSRKTFWDLIIDLAQKGTTIFITTHHMDEAEYCHRISIMVDGKIAAIDSPANLKKVNSSETLQDAFLKIVKTTAE